MSTRQHPEDAPPTAGCASADPRYAAYLGCAHRPAPGTAPDADLTQAEKPAAEDSTNDGEYRVFLRYDTRIAPDMREPVTLSVTDVEYLQDLHRQGIEALGREALGVKSADHFVLRGAGLRFTPHILGGDVRGPDTTGADESIELSLHVPVSTIRRRRRDVHPQTRDTRRISDAPTPLPPARQPMRASRKRKNPPPKTRRMAGNTACSCGTIRASPRI